MAHVLQLSSTPGHAQACFYEQPNNSSGVDSHRWLYGFHPIYPRSKSKSFKSIKSKFSHAGVASARGRGTKGRCTTMDRTTKVQGVGLLETLLDSCNTLAVLPSLVDSL
jgi:hypothetical protein